MFLSLLVAACTSAPSSPPKGDTGGVDTGAPATIPEDCGDTPWGAVDGTLFVDQAAGSGGDGSRDAPFQTIGAAVAASGDDDVVAISAGTYAENVSVADRDLTLAGRCAELVELVGTGEATPLVAFNIDDGAAGRGTLALSGLTLRGGRDTAVRSRGGRLEVRRLRIVDPVYAGIDAADSVLIVEDSEVHGSRADPSVDSTISVGVLAQASEVELRRLLVEESARYGVAVVSSTGVVEDVSVDGTGPDPAVGGIAMALLGSELTVRRLQLLDTTGYGLEVSGGRVTVEDLRIAAQQRGGVNDQDDIIGVRAEGVLEIDGAELEDTHGTVVAGFGPFMLVGEEGGTLRLTDGTLRGVGRDYTSLEVHAEAVLELEDSELVGATPTGTGQAAASTYVLAALVRGDGILRVRDSQLTGFVGTAIHMVSGSASPTVELDDVEIQQVAHSPDFRTPAAIYQQAGALVADGLIVHDVEGPALIMDTNTWEQPTSAHCRNCDFHDLALAGVVSVGVEAGTALELEDTAIYDVATDPSSGLSTGLYLTADTGPSSAMVRGTTIDGVAHAAVAIVGDIDCDLQDSTLHGGAGGLVGGSLLVHGNAVFASAGARPWDGSGGLRLMGNTFHSGAGDAVLLHGASATLEGNRWDDGGVLRQQSCTGVDAVQGAPAAPTVLSCPDTEQLVLEFSAVPVNDPPVEL